MKRSFQRMDDMTMNMCSCGAIGYRCGCHPVDFSFGGTTAVVALLTPEHIVVANCGDSRAVLCRGGKAVPLSVDHKPDRPDEHARITAAGGRVIFLNGARVEGILAMSRAIGN
uniref:PPM-type phosphatase domain-containing protein n=1 Tax=Rhizophora mucronata TaxID=61149 RepID=A0A2P2MHS4_RHIMU